jgi:hypothetical protein
MILKFLYYSATILYSLQGLYVAYYHYYDLDRVYLFMRVFLAFVQVFLHLLFFTPYRITGCHNLLSTILYSWLFPYLINICNFYLITYSFIHYINYLYFGVKVELVGVVILLYTFVYRLFIPVQQLHLK